MIMAFLGSSLNNPGDIPSIPGAFLGLRLLSISSAISIVFNIDSEEFSGIKNSQIDAALDHMKGNTILASNHSGIHRRGGPN